MSRPVALISGAAAGIGRATALGFGAAGYSVAISDINVEGLAATERLVADAHGADAVQCTRVDVARAGECRDWVAAAAGWGGRIDVVANVAAVGQFDGSVATLSETEWDRVLAINLKSVFLISQAAIPHLRVNGGVILNVASPHAFATTVGVAAYAASKGGVVALSRQMAIEFAPDRIRVIPVVPGAVDTAMLRAHAERQHSTLDALGFSTDPGRIGRVGEPEELASAMVWLASPGASFVNGCPFFVDGGLLARL